jgi:hypothetical protein
MNKTLKRLKADGLIEDFVDGVPKIDNYRDERNGNYVLSQFGSPAYKNSLNWYNRAKEYFDKGYIGIGEVNSKKKGHITGQTDHWVLLVGYKEENGRMRYSNEDPTKLLGWRIDQFIGVSCSMWKSKPLEWVQRCNLLQYRGCYNAFFIKPITS